MLNLFSIYNFFLKLRQVFFKTYNKKVRQGPILNKIQMQKNLRWINF